MYIFPGTNASIPYEKLWEVTPKNLQYNTTYHIDNYINSIQCNENQ